MVDLDEHEASATSTTVSMYQPVSSDDVKLEWDGNLAKIDGLLNETHDFLETNGYLEMFLKHRAVPLSNGKLAV